jgi:hypothetical protein
MPVRGELGEYRSLLSNAAAKEKPSWSPRHSWRDHVPSWPGDAAGCLLREQVSAGRVGLT